ncbi:MAG: hypothetical protein IKI76_09730 [Selenomonadaceae bacterium]|nr:hypothetical protein [Selenomonadaceae bacterium]
MSSFFNCAAYEDVKGIIRLEDKVVFLALKIKAKDTDMNLTLNLIQTRTLAKYLTAALTQIDFTDLVDEEHFGDLTVEIEHDNSQYDDAEYAWAVPF